jgi:putative nucleotidyltransferase with HDIG domain
MIPSREECLKLMSRFEMLGNIVEHSLVVAKVALYLSKALNERGQRIDVGLVEAASLLHDITKTECLTTKQDHAQTGAQVLTAMGYGRVARIVAQHVHLLEEGRTFTVTEAEVVYYADKRVRHDQVVSLEERFSDLIDRYGKEEKAVTQLEKLKEATFEVEKKIFSILAKDPEVLQQV